MGQPFSGVNGMSRVGGTIDSGINERKGKRESRGRFEE